MVSSTRGCKMKITPKDQKIKTKPNGIFYYYGDIEVAGSVSIEGFKGSVLHFYGDISCDDITCDAMSFFVWGDCRVQGDITIAGFFTVANFLGANKVCCSALEVMRPKLYVKVKEIQARHIHIPCALDAPYYIRIPFTRKYIKLPIYIGKPTHQP